MTRRTPFALTTRHFITTVNQQQTAVQKPSASPPLTVDVVKVNFYGSGQEQGRLRCDELAVGHDRHSVVKVIIQNLNSGNALTPSLLKSLKTVFRELASRSDLRCVILDGARSFASKNAFCTGMDVRHLAALESPEQARSLILDVYEAGQAIRELPVSTIAQVSGRCFGAGLELAASCDFRFAARHALFAMPEVELGIPSVVQARLLANIIGWQRTRQLLLLGNATTASLAERWGLVDRVFGSHQDLYANTLQTALKIADNAPLAMKAQKRLINYWEETDLVSGIDASVDAFAASFENGAAEPKEYMNRFFARKQAAKEENATLQTPGSLDTTVPASKGISQLGSELSEVISISSKPGIKEPNAATTNSSKVPWS